MDARIKIAGQDNMLEVPNDKAQKIKELWLDKTIPANTPIDLGVMTISKSLIKGVFFGAKETEKFNWYDFSNPELKQTILDFETELNKFDGGFDAFLIHKGADKNNMLAIELNQKLNSLNFLRNLRARAQKHEATANQELEIDMAKIAF